VTRAARGGVAGLSGMASGWSAWEDAPVCPPTLRSDVAHSARLYNYLLGRKDYYAADRELAEALYQVTPDVVTAAREHRAFMRRVAGWMAAEGLGQFVDIGTGLPDSPNLHEVVQAVTATARVLYVDPDPLVLLHARALLTSGPEGATAYLEADVRDPQKILTEAAGAGLDLARPVGLTVLGVLPFVADGAEVAEVVAALVGGLASGSLVALSHATGDFLPDGGRAVAEVYQKHGMVFVPRTAEEVGALVPAGVDLVEPGLVAVHRWWPGPDSDLYPIAKRYTDEQVSIYGLVGRVR